MKKRMPQNNKNTPLSKSSYHLKPIGQGSYCDITLGLSDNKKSPPLCIKLLKPKYCDNKYTRRQFEVETDILKRLKQPAFFPKHVTNGEMKNRPYVAYDFVEQLSLSQVRQLRPEQTSKNPCFAVGVHTQILRALNCLHSGRNPIVHSDINPENIIINNTGQVILIDFGCAHIKTQATDESFLWVSKPSYLSPEQAQGKCWDERSDIYQAGVIFYELITGKRWVKGTNAQDRISHAAAIKPMPDHFLAPIIGLPLSRYFAQMLHPDPNLRIQSAHEATNWIQDIISTDPLFQNI